MESSTFVDRDDKISSFVKNKFYVHVYYSMLFIISENREIEKEYEIRNNYKFSIK